MDFNWLYVTNDGGLYDEEVCYLPKLQEYMFLCSQDTRSLMTQVLCILTVYFKKILKYLCEGLIYVILYRLPWQTDCDTFRYIYSVSACEIMRSLTRLVIWYVIREPTRFTAIRVS